MLTLCIESSCDETAAAVIREMPSQHTLLIDQGAADPFLDQLMPAELRAACESSGQPIEYREREEERIYRFDGDFKLLKVQILYDQENQ